MHMFATLRYHVLLCSSANGGLFKKVVDPASSGMNDVQAKLENLTRKVDALAPPSLALTTRVENLTANVEALTEQLIHSMYLNFSNVVQ